jgi:hypothetical protein
MDSTTILIVILVILLLGAGYTWNEDAPKPWSRRSLKKLAFGEFCVRAIL